jgi:hypothetical protein
MKLPPPPTLSATALWWWGIALFVGQMVITWAYFGIANSGPFGPNDYNNMMIAYQYFSPILWMAQIVGATMIAGGLILRSLHSRREAGVDD